MIVPLSLSIERLNMAMEENGWSTYTLCKAADVGYNSLSSFLNGTYKNMRFDTVARIATTLGVSIDWLCNLKKTEEKKIMTPTEHEEQCTLFEWAEVCVHKDKLKTMFAIPNGGERNIVVAAKLKKEGVKAGVPDILLPYPNGGYNGLFIEMKRREGGRILKKQREWLRNLTENGYVCVIARGFEEAKGAIEKYLRVKS